MPEIPETVRFHFARQAPTAWNWYTKPDFAGCLLKWNPVEDVISYTVFRSTESLPGDCCEDLFNGVYDDVVDRIDIFEPITRLVDDEIHDRNRYLVLAHLDNDDIVWVKDVESVQFSGARPGEKLTYWSNPFGNSPKIKDPCRLDYSTVRVGTFCGFEWDYPLQYPDFTGYELIICDMAYSPHTGADSDIEAFREVLNGSRGVHYSLDKFVSAIVDNESFANRFWYYALLVKLPEGGRVQIPMRHEANGFAPGKPFQYLSARAGWGEGRERMMAAYAKWKNQVASGKMSASTMATNPEIDTSDVPGNSGFHLDYFRHSPDLSLESFKEYPDMIGIQFSARVSENDRIVAIRSVSELDDESTGKVLKRAIDENSFSDESVDAFVFNAPSQYMVLVDADCHTKTCYAFAVYDEATGRFSELEHVKDVTIDYLDKPEDVIRWGDVTPCFSNRLVHVLKVEEMSKKSLLSIAFGIVDESTVSAIELYRFDSMPEWDESNLSELYALQSDGKSSNGVRYRIDHLCRGIVDDVSECHCVHYYAAVCLDKYDNRTSISVFNQGSQAHPEWELLSSFVDEPETNSEPEAVPVEIASEPEIESVSVIETEQKTEKKRSEEVSTVSRRESRTSRRRYNWDDEPVATPPARVSNEDLTSPPVPNEDLTSSPVPNEVLTSSSVPNEVLTSSPAPKEAGTEVRSSTSSAVLSIRSTVSSTVGSGLSAITGNPSSGRRRRYNWDDDPLPSSVNSTAGEDKTRSSVVTSSVSSVSSERAGVRRRRYNWEDEELASPPSNGEGESGLASSSLSNAEVVSSPAPVSNERVVSSVEHVSNEKVVSSVEPVSNEKVVSSPQSNEKLVSGERSSVSSIRSGIGRTASVTTRASGRRYNWEDEESNTSQSVRRVSQSGIRKRHYSWEDDEDLSSVSSSRSAKASSTSSRDGVRSSVSSVVSAVVAKVSGERSSVSSAVGAVSRESGDNPAVSSVRSSVSSAVSAAVAKASGERSSVSSAVGAVSRESGDNPAVSSVKSSVSDRVRAGASSRLRSGTRRRYNWDDEPVPAPAEPVSPDDAILGILSECRANVLRGDIDKARELIESARTQYGNSLRLEAFSSNYLS